MPERLRIDTPKEAKVLTRPEIDSFHENGFVVVKGAMPPDEARELGEKIDWVIDKKRRGKNVLWQGAFVDQEERGKRIINDLHGGQQELPDISRWLTDPRHLIAPAQLIGPEVALHHIKAISKPGQTDTTVGGNFPMHQDAPFFGLRNDRVVAGLLSLTEGNEENGGLIGFPGSHKRGWLLEDQEPNPDDAEVPFEHLRQDRWPSLEATRINTEPGDMVVFSVNFVHGSGVNHTDRPRTNLISQLMHPSNTFTEEEKRAGAPHQSHAQGMMLCDAADLRNWGVPGTLIPAQRAA